MQTSDVPIRRTEVRAAFTLIEVTTVTSIILILSACLALSLPAGLTERVEELELKQQILSLELACDAFCRSHGRYPWTVNELYEAELLAPDSLKKYSRSDLFELVITRPARGESGISSARVVPTGRARR